MIRVEFTNQAPGQLKLSIEPPLALGGMPARADMAHDLLFTALRGKVSARRDVQEAAPLSTLPTVIAMAALPAPTAWTQSLAAMRRAGNPLYTMFGNRQAA